MEKDFRKNSWYHLLPNHDLEVCEENLQIFFKYVFERQEIWYKRFILKQQAPWTDWDLLRDYKFTNVYRELDRSSQYLIKNVLKKETVLREIVWKTILFRYFNNPELFEVIDIPNFSEYSIPKFYKKVDDYRKAGGNPFTNAYMINATLAKGQERHAWYLKDAIPFLHSKVYAIIDAIEEAEKERNPLILINELTKLKAVSTFLAHEFYQDFCDSETYGVKIMDFDKNDYTNVGPGCSLGIRLIFPSCKTMKDQEKMIFLLKDISSEYLKQFGDFKYLNYNRESEEYFVIPGVGELNLHNIEFSLCEAQKLWKMKIKLGKQRTKFKPITLV